MVSAQRRVSHFIAGDAKQPLCDYSDIAKMAMVALHQGPPDDGQRYLPVWSDFVSGEEVCRIMEELRGGAFAYSAPPAFVLRLFAPEIYLMRQDFESRGRPPLSQDVRTFAQMTETRRLLNNTHTTMRQWLKDQQYATKALPQSSSIWTYVLVGVGAGIFIVILVVAIIVIRRCQKGSMMDSDVLE